MNEKIIEKYINQKDNIVNMFKSGVVLQDIAKKYGEKNKTIYALIRYYIEQDNIANCNVNDIKEHIKRGYSTIDIATMYQVSHNVIKGKLKKTDCVRYRSVNYKQHSDVYNTYKTMPDVFILAIKHLTIKDAANFFGINEGAFSSWYYKNRKKYNLPKRINKKKYSILYKFNIFVKLLNLKRKYNNTQ